MTIDVPTIYTIGHSNHQIEDFLGLLRSFDIACVVDVRSAPYSKYAAQFNKEPLNNFLQQIGLQYVYMGQALGGRWTDPELYFPDHIIDYAKVSRTDAFRQGMTSLLKNIRKGVCAALMCCEKDPYDCHRFVLVSRFLKEEGVVVRHILADRTILENTELEARLLAQYPPAQDLFAAPLNAEDVLKRAYIQRNRDMAYRLPEDSQV
ncbi:MAG: DUF488 domain-containing protein [Candidatus Omnitrophica bacterium]|nr:DUF488 domain-containing protein [Candidatus Omnitrophota bacterium]